MKAMDLSNLYVFCDIDGTLGLEGQGVPRRNHEAIRRFTDRGGHFGLCTSRWIQGVRTICQDLPINGPSIIGNGAGIYDFAQNMLLDKVLLPSDAAALAQEVLRDHPSLDLLAVHADSSPFYIPATIHTNGVLPRPLVPFYEIDQEALQGPFVKCMFGLPTGTAYELAQGLNKRYAQRGLHFVASSDHSIEMLPQDTNKGMAIKETCRMLEIPLENTVFIGNYFDDLEALIIAGTSCCVADTPKALRFAADYVLGSAMRGGVADILNLLMRHGTTTGPSRKVS